MTSIRSRVTHGPLNVIASAAKQSRLPLWLWMLRFARNDGERPRPCITRKISQPQIRLAYIRIGPDLRRAALHQHAAGLQDVGAIGDFEALGNALLDDQHGHAGVADAFDRLKDFVDQFWHDALRRL